VGSNSIAEEEEQQQWIIVNGVPISIPDQSNTKTISAQIASFNTSPFALPLPLIAHHHHHHHLTLTSLTIPISTEPSRNQESKMKTNED
jgi:hypothetical protein